MRSLKIQSAEFNNRKKQLTVFYQSGKEISIHYGSLGFDNNLREVWVDRETRGKSLGLRFDTGEVEYMPYDQPLALAKDPEFLLQNQIERLIAQIKEVLRHKKISKRYLAKQLHTSDNQVQRLLDPGILNKNLPQLYQLADLIGLELELHPKAA